MELLSFGFCVEIWTMLLFSVNRSYTLVLVFGSFSSFVFMFDVTSDHGIHITVVCYSQSVSTYSSRATMF